ncbi:MAG: hypothetical protein U9Q66_02810 [Patescibacteria group bacterium]|nr:hypothetical protein [Patescibacteria group bacterium]
MIYVTESSQHNDNIFAKETSDILTLEITKELVAYLKIKLDN